MGIEICAVGGYEEVGKNMTAIKVDDEVIICDMGLHIENYIRFTEDEDLLNINPNDLVKVGAIPDITPIKDWRTKVKAIIPTHAHLDHIGAIPFMSNKFDAPVLATPFSIEVIKSILKNEKIEIRNRLMVLNPNAQYYISDKIKIEFINMTHSTPQTVMVAIHTPYGIIVYANDFKFDSYPVLGKPPNYDRLRALGKKGVLALIVDTLYAHDARKMPSESVAKEMLRDVLLGTESQGKAVIVTTFSSHLARLKSIIEMGKKLNRKIVFCGRSLSKYVEAGEACGIIKFSKDVEMVKFGSKVKKRMKQIMKRGKDKFLLVVTGHQGEPKATLSKMADGQIGFKFNTEDHVVFSSTVIPTKTNQKYRDELEKKLKAYGVRIFKDIHISGHAAREDLRDLVNMLKPKHILPSHAPLDRKIAFSELAIEMGYKPGQIHIIKDGEKLSL